MGAVTNILILCSYHPHEVINDYLEPFIEDGNFKPFELIDPHKVGGNMMMEADILAGAFKHEDMTLFLECMKKYLNENEAYEVQVLIKYDHEDYFKFYSAADLIRIQSV